MFNYSLFNYFRHHPLRKCLWLIVLLSSLLVQSQNLFACKFMDDGAKTTCCCEDSHNHDPANHEPTEEGDDSDSFSEDVSCCDVILQVNVGLQNTVAADIHHNEQTLFLDTPQPPPAIIIEYQVYTPLQNFKPDLPHKNVQYSAACSGTDTYSKTHRLRI